MTAAFTTPAIMSAPMIRALLNGSKSQTRRLVTSQWANLKMHFDMSEPCFVWVREAWQLHSRATDLGKVVYRASEGASNTEFHRLVPVELIGNAQPKPFQEGWRPSIHMPRWASRLTLEVTDVRVQRLQEISREDAAAEGIPHVRWLANGQYYGINAPIQVDFAKFWESLHGKGSWDTNPAVIAISFRVHHQNIDALLSDRRAA